MRNSKFIDLFDSLKPFRPMHLASFLFLLIDRPLLLLLSSLASERVLGLLDKPPKPLRPFAPFLLSKHQLSLALLPQLPQSPLGILLRMI